jgi:hypothetical protein
MNVQKKTTIEFPSEVFKSLDEVTACVQELEEKYSEKKEISKEIQQAVKVLASCNESLDDKKIISGPKVNINISDLLNVLMNLHVLNNDKTLQEKVNALQAGLFSRFFNELTNLEENLKGDKWRVGLKVKATERSKKS